MPQKFIHRRFGRKRRTLNPEFALSSRGYEMDWESIDELIELEEKHGADVMKQAIWKPLSKQDLARIIRGGRQKPDDFQRMIATAEHMLDENEALKTKCQVLVNTLTILALREGGKIALGEKEYDNLAAGAALNSERANGSIVFTATVDGKAPEKKTGSRAYVVTNGGDGSDGDEIYIYGACATRAEAQLLLANEKDRSKYAKIVEYLDGKEVE